MADIKINQQQWDTLSEEDQKTITKGLRAIGALRIGDHIVGDPNIPPFDPKTHLQPMDILKDLCKVACDVAAKNAEAWCYANAGPALPVCLAAAEAARQLCRDRC